jgi:hypothetical protein
MQLVNVPPTLIQSPLQGGKVLNYQNYGILFLVIFAMFCFIQPVNGHLIMSSNSGRTETLNELNLIDTSHQREWSDKRIVAGPFLADTKTKKNQPPTIMSHNVEDKASNDFYSLWQWSFKAGYRHDELDWSFALPTINIRSELIWRDLESIQFEFGLERRLWRYFRLKGYLGYAFLFDGENQDSDYNGNDRTEEFSRSNNSTQDGDLWDISIGLAYDFPLLANRITLSPVIGFSYHDQNLQITRGVQTIPPLGPFPGLNSSYDPTWYGPWIGADFQYNSYGKAAPKPGYEAFFGIEYHFANFEAKADWNLRADLAHPVSFRQDADGSGWVLTGGINYLFNKRWSTNLTGKYQKWETSDGRHRFFFFDGSSYQGKLNGVNWDSFSISVGITCRF